MADPTEKVAIGDTGVTVTRLGLGSTPFGNLLSEVSDEDAAQSIETAWNLGIRYYDTAPFYGYGLAEERIGMGLRPHNRSDFALSSKVGRLVRKGPRTAADEIQENGEPYYYAKPDMMLVSDYSYDAVFRSIEESLTRLGQDRIDIAYIHDPDLHFEDTVNGACKALVELREQGVVKAIGSGMNQWEMLSNFLDHVDFDIVLLAGRYSLLEQPALESFLPKCIRTGCRIALGGVFNSGLLADPRGNATYNYKAAPSDLVERALKIESVCKRFDVPLKAAALQFPLGHEAIASVLIGVRKATEVEENVRLFSTDIPAELWHALKTEGLLPESCPVPQTLEMTGT
ncbi:aldo/keto reductase [Cognatishimia activa]|uniref:Pyridoxal 4-dehydrogenase n=1 Tax=Cognatishimia activa TaxID=1715691 RepID=A0A0P1IQ46_9RHOB|nr:aldo/keto reductase [Cognatishimia activa]CUI88929.1 Pyridoxal 4-dehydrogenase [Cognatishimia activa]CUK25655.1 Pyridoxal 4-dehydrogenase [Cognatishimia activa]